MAENKETQGAQTGAPSAATQGEAASNLVKHIVTELDIQHNPDLTEKGIKVGDEIQIPVDAKERSDARQVEAKSVADAKAMADKVAGPKDAKTDKKAKKFEVVSPFRDKDDFSKQYEVGNDVSHFDADRLKDLITRELVKEVK